MWKPLTLSVRQTKTDTCAFNVVPDETARDDQDVHCLLLFFNFSLKPLFAPLDMFKFNDGRVHFRNAGIKELNIAPTCFDKMLMLLNCT